jgi:hypothetical protein
MPSRQERRQAERDAAKRAPAKAGAASAGPAGAGGGAATARANVNMNPVGDWTTQAEDPYVLFHAIGAHVVKQRARAGDRQGLTLVHFSAQLEPCVTQENTLHTLKHPPAPPYHGLHNPYAHPLSHKKRSS